MSWITGIVSAFVKWMLIFSGVAILLLVLVSGDFLPGGDTVRVLYLNGQRVCDSGYDYKTPRCRFVFADEWSSQKWDTRWAILEQETGKFIRYDGWYVKRSEIELDMEAGYSEIIDNLYLEAALREYETWDEVDWEQAFCYAEVIGTFEPTEHCEDLYHGRKLSRMQIEHNESIYLFRAVLKWVGIGVASLILFGYAATIVEWLRRRQLRRRN